LRSRVHRRGLSPRVHAVRPRRRGGRRARARARAGGTFIALLGGGPTAHGDDAFHAFARLLPAGRALGDPRAKSEAGWRELFVARGWRELAFERWPVDLSGTFDEVWAFLGSSYQLAPGDAERVRAALRAQFPGERVRCEVACYCASVRR